MSTKQMIFESALALFSEKGFDGVSVRDIAKAVGIKESSIYNHFEGKKAIFDSICGEFRKTLAVSRPPLAEIEQMLEKQPPGNIFKLLILSYGRQIKPQTTQMAKAVFSEQFHHETARSIILEDIVQKNVEYYESLFKLMVLKKKIRPCDTNAAAHLFNNQQIALCIQYADCRTDEERSQLGKRMTRSVDFLFGLLECR